MSSKYDKTIQISREEEGTYHGREVEYSKPKKYTTESYEVVPARTHSTQSVRKKDFVTSDDDDDNYEEWTVSKRKVNHKTRQVETRVSRQLLVEDGKVIADSGPQVTTRITEDNKVEECEKEKTPKNKSKFDAIENAPEGESTGRVLGEKKEIQKVSREVREENMQYHDERFKELTGHDVHRRAIQAPHELITINDKSHSASSQPRGKMVHYSNKGKKYQDTDEILEVAKLAIDGSITKEVKRTRHHEECSEDEKPDETGEAEVLRHAPTVTRSSRRHVDYVNDFDDTSTPSSSDDETGAHKQKHSSGITKTHHKPSTASSRTHHPHHHSHSHHHHHHHKSRDDEAAFPRYEIDPLLNSLNDHDFKPTGSSTTLPTTGTHSDRIYKKHTLERKDHSYSDSSDDERHHSYSNRQQLVRPVSPQNSYHETNRPVEIPEEYRVSKRERSKTTHHRSVPTTTATSGHERSFSPTSKSHLSHKSSKSNKEDASVQAHLTDEEEADRKSIKSSSTNSHQRTTNQLQRLSTQGSRRNYYYGNSNKSRPKSPISTSSSSSFSDPKERMRKDGVRSRDSGFKSPHSHRTATPISSDGHQQIYSVSSKAKRDPYRAGAISPTPTSGSVGQRSVKTTTTTMSAGLEEKLPRRPERSSSHKNTSTYTKSKRNQAESANAKNIILNESEFEGNNVKYFRSNELNQATILNDDYEEPNLRRKHSFDTVSLSSLGPLATTIKVPYKQAHEHQFTSYPNEEFLKPLKTTQSEMSFNEDIENLRQRLVNINKNNHTNRITITRDDKQTDDREGKAPNHFNYKTIITSLQPSTPMMNSNRQQTIDAYNVRVIEHNSPFHQQYPRVNSMSELSSSIARLESISSEISSLQVAAANDSKLIGHQTDWQHNTMQWDNNNESNFNIDEFVKHRAIPVTVESADSLGVDDDRGSMVSSSSMRSSRTYSVRPATSSNFAPIDSSKVTSSVPDRNHYDEDFDDEKHFPVETRNFNELAHERRPAAWIFDITSGSSTDIIAPPKPEKPEPPKVDAKEIAQAKGGKSYYLEVVEPEKSNTKVPTRPRPSSIDTLYSRWSSQGSLSQLNKARSKPRPTIKQQNNKQPPAVATAAAASVDETRKSRQLLPASLIQTTSRPNLSTSTNNNTLNLTSSNNCADSSPNSQLKNRSKSSSCLLESTRSSKYSIYGGLRQQNGEKKTVPRLSYSRAIGPKSQRQTDVQTKTPSRYLKMK